MKTLLKYIRPYGWAMTWGLTIKFAGTIMDLMIPWILEYLLDDVVPAGNRAHIFLWGGVMILCSAVAVAGNIIANRKASRVARDVTRSLRHDLFDKTMRLSAADVDRFTIPTLETRLTSDTYNIHQVIGMMQRLGVRAPILLIGGIILTSLMEPVLTLVLLAVLPLIVLVFVFITRKGVPLYTKLQGAVDRLVRVVRENVQGIRVIKALSKTDYEGNRFEGANAEVTEKETRAGVVMAATGPLMSLLLNGGLTAVVLVGAFRVNGGLTEPGKIIAFLTYFTIILNAMMSINRMFVMYSRGAASAGRIEEVLLTPAEGDAEPDGAAAAEPVKPAEAGVPHIQFENVCFSYNKVRENLTDLSFSLPRGGMLGVIGATGSGKSTLLRLLMRFYNPDSGRILIDGTDLRDLPLGPLRERFGAVQQSDILFADTVAENVRLGRPLSDDDVRQALRAAQADDFVTAYEDGMQHELAIKGSDISGGQKQRLLIARALCGKPEILILDDCSSALDYKTDANLRRAIREGYADTTTVVVAQRVSSVMNADLILVLDEGRIIGSGNHAQLLESCPVYKEISDSQMGGAFLE